MRKEEGEGHERTRVLYVDDEPANLLLFKRLFSNEVDLHVVGSAKEARGVLAQKRIHILITDQRMPQETGLDFLAAIGEDYPECAKVVLTAYSDRHVMRRAFQSSQIMDFILKPFEENDMREVFRRGRELFEENLRQAKINQNYENLRHDLDQDHGRYSEIIGAQKGLKALVDRIRKVADGGPHITVLIRGESGTGKELVARAIHFNSARKQGPFIAVNCAAMAENLWESELFGHERGAFSGAHKRKLGRFELANQGTLFLDEISEIPPHLQVKLLRALQERTFERVGGTQSIPMDVRIIAASNRDLEREVLEGGFRKDLYFRLNVIPIQVPALREHAQDVPELIDHFLKRANRKAGRSCSLDSQTLNLLMQYSWPGNVRELENLVERAVLLSDSSVLDLNAFMIDLEKTAVSAASPLLQSCGHPAESWAADEESAPGMRGSFREELRREEIARYKEALRQARGNISRAAKILGMHRRTLTDRLKKVELI